MTSSKESAMRGVAESLRRDVPWPSRLVEVPAPGGEPEVAKALDACPEPVFTMSEVARHMWWLEGLYVQRDILNDGEMPS